MNNACKMIFRNMALQNIAAWRSVLEDIDGDRAPCIGVGEFEDSEASPVAVEMVQMVKCPICGALHLPGRHSCTSAGAPIPPDTVWCHKCQQIVPANKDHVCLDPAMCPECGGPSEGEG